MLGILKQLFSKGKNSLPPKTESVTVKAKDTDNLQGFRMPAAPKAGVAHDQQDARFVEVAPAAPTTSDASYRTPAITISNSRENLAASFIKDARIYHNKTGQPCSPVPFTQYWPTYSTMSPDQKNWYFYWRSEARKVHYLPTDLSYIFVHVYELLNLVETSTAIESSARIKALWTIYRQQYPTLDNYLPDWGGDILATYQGIDAMMAWWLDCLSSLSNMPADLVNAMVHRYVNSGKTAEMPYALWMTLTGYRPRNKFYLEHNTDGQLDQSYNKAILLADQYWRKTTQRSLIEHFAPVKLIPLSKSAFNSALVALPHSDQLDLGMGRHYVGLQTLDHHLTSVIKYAENILRSQAGYSRKLSGIDLDVDLAQVLDEAFTSSPTKQETFRLSIDPSRVADLHKESKVISEMLAPVEDTLQPSQSSTTKPLYTELAEVRQVWRKLNATHKMLVNGIFHGRITSQTQASQLLSNLHTLPNDAINSINEITLPLIGDQLVYIDDGRLSLAQDFLDELDVVLRESPSEELTPTSQAAPPADPWVNLFTQLSPPEIALIHLFAQAGELSENDIATAMRSHNVMANAVMDSLSEKAADALGHPPLYFDNDKWIIEAEDLTTLRQQLSNIGGN
jgi:hypothetical protein